MRVTQVIRARLAAPMRTVLLALLLPWPVAAHADVTAQTELGFVSRNVVMIAADPQAVWKRLLAPAGWWSSDHTFSGDAANMTLDPVAGGCFCEKLPSDDAGPAKPGAGARAVPRGGVEHMRVVFIDRAKALRMTGALGPLQSEAVNATLTVTLKAGDGGTRVIFEYVVGGYMRYPADKIAPAVDAVMGSQLLALAKLFGPVVAPAPESERPVQSGTGGLDKKGLLLPRGRVWSLPTGAQPAASAPAPIGPLQTAPVQDDLAPAGGAETLPGQASALAPERAAAAPDSVPSAPKAAVKRRAAPATSNKAASTPVPKATPPSDEPAHDTVNSAFDAAFSGAPRPAENPRLSDQ